MRHYYRFSALIGGAILIGILALSVCQAAQQTISAIADSTTSRADLRGKVNAELLKVQANFAELYNVSPGSVSDSAYDATTWDGVTNSAPSKNAVRDAIQALPGITNGTGITFTSATVEGVTTTTIAGKGTVAITATKSASYTIGTDSTSEAYGGTIFVTSAATITAPAVASGMSFAVVTIGDIAVSLDVNAADKMILDGVALADGDKAANSSKAGDTIVCQYYSADGYYCWSSTVLGGHWTDGN